MTNPKTDVFSRVVAFIVALAIAMLTVTLIHRNVISAETGEAAESAIESIEASLSEAAAISEALENESLAVQENEYEEFTDLNYGEDLSISVFADEGNQANPYAEIRYINAEDYIVVRDSKIYLSGSELKNGTIIRYGRGRILGCRNRRKHRGRS